MVILNLSTQTKERSETEWLAYLGERIEDNHPVTIKYSKGKTKHCLLAKWLEINVEQTSGDSRGFYTIIHTWVWVDSGVGYNGPVNKD